ncbi:TPA: retinoic acid early transcript 1E-like [Bos taurus]|nr:TPA: retinoic acid early transcript 1E-like [Bos taurus]
MAGIRLQPLATGSPEELGRDSLTGRAGLQGPRPPSAAPRPGVSLPRPPGVPAPATPFRTPPAELPPSRGHGASGRDSKERFKLKTPRRVSELLLWLRTRQCQMRESDLGWTGQARTAPRRSQEPDAEKEWAGFLSLGLKTLGGARRQRYRHTPGYLLLVTLLKLQGGMSLARTADHLLLILLLIEARKTLGNAHSLCLDLTVKSQSRPGQPWCQVQGSVDTKPFLQYDSASNKVKPLGFLGKEVNDTKAWTEISQTLVEAGKELRMVLPVIKLDENETRGPPTLQVKLCCQREAEQCSGASLHFSLNGRTALLLDTMSITWTVIDPGATGIKEEWRTTRNWQSIQTISTGDCSYWLRDS